MGKQTTFDHPGDLREAQRALKAARDARSAFLALAPKWAEAVAERTLSDGTVVPAEPGWNEEQHQENRRLLTGEQEAALAVWAHPFRESLPAGDRVEARTNLTQAPRPGGHRRIALRHGGVRCRPVGLRSVRVAPRMPAAPLA
ncbi:hypothetical protein [Kitasatospora sp. NPDC051914]|uniref:hypothetical protein n=1 Tax=Kitasatospora sp. NPDC051914 TaxID=3154945 RepID=UPI00341ADE39